MATHRTNLEMSQSAPLEVEAGADIILRVKVSCPEGCDLRGIPVSVMAADSVISTTELATFDEAVNETEAFALKAPGKVGEHAWTVLFPRHENEGAVHEESRLLLSFTTRPHATSMAVWDVPSPVVMNRSFTVKVGVKCSATCQLAGRLVEVCDGAGTPIGRSTLGETPWPGTSGLYVADVELAAPATDGTAFWSARFAAAEPGLPHDEASAAFSLRIARPPEHRVTVQVADKGTKAPLENVEVRLGVYRASTDAAGLVNLELPGGVYALDAWKAGYEMLTRTRTVKVGKDRVIRVEAVVAPQKDPDDQRVWM
jgi:hypothetical protein